MLTEKQKLDIIVERSKGSSAWAISKQLKIPYSTTRNFMAKYKKDKTIENRKSTGRRPSLSEYDFIELESIKKETPLVDAVTLSTKLHEKNKKEVSSQTIRNGLNMMGYFNGSVISKPCLTKKHQKRRFDIVSKWALNPHSFWKNIIFSDEVPFQLKNGLGVTKCWKKVGDSYNPDYINKTFKYGGGTIMFWGCFSAQGVGNLVVIDGIMDRFKYVKILANNLTDSASKLGLKKFIFQQDNDPKHTSKHAKSYFTENNIQVLNGQLKVQI